MSTNLKQYKTLSAFKAAEPEISHRVFMLATRLASGYTDDTGRKIPAWPKAVVWFCCMIQPTRDGSKFGCDALQVEHAMQEYCRKPLVVQGHPEPWALMTYIAHHTNTRIRVDEVRWAEVKQMDRATASGALQRLGDSIPANLLPRKGAD